MNNQSKTGNPLKTLFLAISKLPAFSHVAMLLIIIGWAVITTMMVTGKVQQQEEARSRASATTIVDPNRILKNVVCSRSYLPSGAKIERKQLEMRAIDELDVFEDAENSLSDVVGAAPTHSIPAHAQVRHVDLQ